jgi:hypothetical protein
MEKTSYTIYNKVKDLSNDLDNKFYKGKNRYEVGKTIHKKMFFLNLYKALKEVEISETNSKLSNKVKR